MCPPAGRAAPELTVPPRRDAQKLRFGPWLLNAVSSGLYHGLCWIDPARQVFRIPWKHNARKDVTSSDVEIFKVGDLAMGRPQGAWGIASSNGGGVKFSTSSSPAVCLWGDPRVGEIRGGQRQQPQVCKLVGNGMSNSGDSEVFEVAQRWVDEALAQAARGGGEVTVPVTKSCVDVAVRDVVSVHGEDGLVGRRGDLSGPF